MLVRRRLLKVGDVVQVNHCAGAYRLPEGLPEQSRVTVVALAVGYADVRDARGQVFHVAFGGIDFPDDVWWNGAWIDRLTHPEGAQAFAYWQAHEEAEREEGRWREFVR